MRPHLISLVVDARRARQFPLDQQFARQALLRFALSTAVRVSAEIGGVAVLTHPLDEELRGFYARFGFEALPGDPQRSMAVRVGDLVASGF